MSALDRYTTERLTQDLTSQWPGERNSAPYLLELDTPARRLRAVQEAHTLSNLMGLIHSQAVYDAVKTLQKNIANGEEEKPLYGEATAKKYRDAEEENRKIIRGY